MKVDNNINYHISIPKYKPKYGLEQGTEGNLCEDKSVNRGYYGGSSVSFGSAAKLFTSRKFGSLLDACGNHTTIIQNLVALVLALGPRPIAILSLPGKKNKEDKIYASGHSMASGIIGFAFSSIVMYPLGVAAQNVKSDAKTILGKITKSKDIKYLTRHLTDLAKEENILPEKLTAESLLEGTNLDADFLKQFGETIEKDGKVIGLKNLNKNMDFKKVYNDYAQSHLSRKELVKGTKYVKEKFANLFADYDANGKFLQLNKKIDFDKVYKAINMAPDVFIFGILKAMLTVAMIPPILKYVFGIEKGKPAQKPQQSNQPAKVEKSEGGNK